MTVSRLAFVVPGPPRPWQRCVRKFSRTQRRFVVAVPAKTRAYQRHVKACASAARLVARSWDDGARYLVRARIYFATAHRRDVDNVQKNLGDAGNGVLWRDDSQIVRWEVTKEIDRERPRVEVEVEVIA